MATCASKGGCPSDYVALSAALVSMILLLLKVTLPYMIHKIPRSKGSSFWLVAVQVVASLNLLLSIVMALNFLKFRKRHWWRSCYLWAVWIEGPLGFGLLLSCRTTQIFQLYYIFVKRRLPPIRSYIFLLLILFPWIAVAAYNEIMWKYGILVDEELREQVVEVRRINDGVLTVKLVIRRLTLNMISAYAQQMGLEEEIKKCFWLDLDEVVRGIPHFEKLFIGRDFKGHIGLTTNGYDSMHGGFGFGVRNGGGA